MRSAPAVKGSWPYARHKTPVRPIGQRSANTSFDVNQSLPPGKYWTRAAVPPDLRSKADAAKTSFLRDLRSVNPEEYQRYMGKDAGHVPDTTWSGVATTGNWMPLTASVNRSIGSQAQSYPYGYRARCFISGTWIDGKCLPTDA